MKQTEKCREIFARASQGLKTDVTLGLDPSLAPKEYTITCDGKTALIKGGDEAALSYAGGRFLAELVKDGEGQPCEIRNTMLRLRDPCILVHGGRYYIVGSSGHGYCLRSSDDMHSWSEPWPAFDADTCTDPAFDGIANYWAPELYEYKEQFYIFGSYKSASTGHRGVAVFRSDSLEGGFEMISEGQVTPKGWDSIDGSLYVDEKGEPWMVFVHEWTCMPDGIGTMVASRMTPDLTALTGEISTLFSASELSDAPKNNVTDGPYIYRFEDGKLAMIWSGFKDGSYCVGVCYSENGILGPWVQAEKPLYRNDGSNPTVYQEGGHGMLFETLGGRLMLSIHSPNSDYEAVTYREIVAENDELRLK